jgi:hypothetical protein
VLWTAPPPPGNYCGGTVGESPPESFFFDRAAEDCTLIVYPYAGKNIKYIVPSTVQCTTVVFDFGA